MPGLGLAALAFGPRGGIPVLALHGWLDNAASFARLGPLLPGVRLVALDLPGHGHSDHRAPGVHYHFIDWVADVVAAADALGWERFALLGHSMGAGAAVLVAGAVPERVTQLALVEGLGPLASSPEEAPLRLAEALARRGRREEKAARRHADLETAVGRLRQVNPGLSEEGARLLVERGTRRDEGGGVTWRADPRLRGLSPMRLSEAHVQAFLRRIACPVLLVRGREGFAFDRKTIEARLRVLEASCPRLRVLDLPGGHHLHLEQPGPVAAALEPFFAEAALPPWERPAVELERLSVGAADLAAARALELVVLDVDGVLTPGTLEYGPQGNDRQTFDVKDGLGIKLLQRAGLSVALLSGRGGEALRRRAAELGISEVVLGVERKLPALRELLARLGVHESRAAYMGDDLNDLACLRAVGYPTAPADARPEVRRAALYVSGSPGGRGAVRDLAEHLLRLQGRFEAALEGL